MKYEPFAMSEGGLPVQRMVDKWGNAHFLVLNMETGKWAKLALDSRTARWPRAIDAAIRRMENALL